MIPSMISFYLAVGTLCDNEGNREHGYDEEREKAIQQLNDQVQEEERERDAILYEEDYFYTQEKYRGKGKSGGKKGGRSTKSKFSEKNLITFHKKNDQDKKKRNAKKTLNEERKYLHETNRPLEARYFKKGREINLCPQEIDINKQEKQFMTRNQIITQEQNDNIEWLWKNMKGERLQEEAGLIYENGIQIFHFRKDIITQEFYILRRRAIENLRLGKEIFENEKKIFLEDIEINCERNIQKQVIPLEIDLVNLTLAQEQIAQQIREINIQLDGWHSM